MHNVHTTMQSAIAPLAPPPITPTELLELRAKAWAEVERIEASDANYRRALRDQQQHLSSLGVI
jgi:hypothetical protein